MHDLPEIHIEFLDFIGLIGAVLILMGFYRISIGRWTNKSLWYELDNLVGATCLVIYQFSHGAYISVTVNIFWAIIAFRGITSYAQRRAQKKSQRTKRQTRSVKRRRSS